MEKKIKRSELLKKLGVVTGVSNLCSPRSYRPVANQYELKHENGRAFQSYDSLIAVRLGGVLYLTDNHDYSNTTSKYATEWTGYNTAERRKGLQDGRFVRITEG
jgi:hypothetical protein